ncbi:MAG: PAS domain S-box protein [Desulfobacterales bacterium]|nr:PAS domain S-box protein [Desulfobacterales bacterium]
MRKNLRQKVIINFLAGAGIPLLCFGILIVVLIFTTQKQQALELESEVAMRVSNKLVSYIEGLVKELNAVIHLQKIQNLNYAEQYDLFGILQSHERAFYELTLVDENGNERVKKLRLDMSSKDDLKNISDLNAFKMAKKNKKPYFGKVRLDEKSGDMRMKIAAPLVLLMENKVNYVIIANVDLKWIWDFVAHIKKRQGEQVYIVDSNKKIIAYHNPSIVLKNTFFTPPSENGIYKGIDNTWTIMAVNKIKFGDKEFSVIVERRLIYAFDLAFKSILIILPTILTIFIIAMFLGIKAVSKIVKPIQILADTALKIESGNFSEFVEIKNEDEIGDLAAAFNNMIKKIDIMMERLREEIMERRLAEDVLKGSYSLLSSVIESPTDYIIFSLDKHYKYTAFNSNYKREVKKIWGKDIDLGTNILDIIGKEYFERAKQNMDRALEGKHFTFTQQFGIGRESVYYEQAYNPIFDGRGNVIGITIFVTNITERKKSEEDLLRLAKAIEQTAEGILITEKDGIIIYLNPAFELITGYSSQELKGKNFKLLRSELHDDEFHKVMWQHLSSGDVWSGHIMNKKKDGTICELEVTISPIRNSLNNITSFVSVNKDVTKIMRLERELRQAQKMEAIGTLAGGIAHDFNNILAGIVGYAELASFGVQKGGDTYNKIQKILSASNRAKGLIRQILAFSRYTKIEKKPVEITSITEEALKLVRASLPSTIEIKKNISSKSSIVMADPTQIHQILMNLSTNALHAMEKNGGILEISLHNVEVDADTAKFYSDLKEGYYAKLIVSDTGHGIESAILEKIFDPFFTTKQTGKGTGLGLSVIHGIVKDLGGTITVYSKPGKGTTFHIFLPIVDTKGMQINLNELHIDGNNVIAVGTERILFVDDEEILIELGKQLLEPLGYKVTATTDSREAFEIFKEQPNKFDLVLTDQTMPKLTGLELAKKILKIRDIPIILCSGFSDSITPGKLHEIGIAEFIMKPFVKKEIAQIIRKILDKKNRDY